MPDSTQFKSCGFCGKTWSCLADLLTDSELAMHGYQACFTHPRDGLFLFTHNVEHCHSTLSIRVGEFEYLYKGARYFKCLAGADVCPLYCLDPHSLADCCNPCTLAWTRSLLQIVQQKHVPVC